MRTSYTRTAAPASEPLTTAEAKAYLRVDGSDDDTSIGAFVSACREAIEEFTGRAFISQTWRMTLDTWPSGCGAEGRLIAIERAPVTAVSSVKYYPADGGAQVTLTAGTHYRVHLRENGPTLIERIDDYDWPDLAERLDAVEVVFVAGADSAAAVPPVLVHALKLLLTEFYEIRSTTNIGNIVNELPRFRNLLESKRVGGWVA